MAKVVVQAAPAAVTTSGSAGWEEMFDDEGESPRASSSVEVAVQTDAESPPAAQPPAADPRLLVAAEQEISRLRSANAALQGAHDEGAWAAGGCEAGASAGRSPHA